MNDRGIAIQLWVGLKVGTKCVRREGVRRLCMRGENVRAESVRAENVLRRGG